MRLIPPMLASSLILCLSVTTLATVQSDGLPFSNPIPRQGDSLSGPWKYIVDPYENGYYNYRQEPFDRQEGFQSGAYFSDAVPSDPSDRIEYDFDRSDDIQVPGDWNTQKENLFFYEGTVWYRKKFPLEAAQGKRYFLLFGAANYETHAYLNGKKLGTNVGGFTPFHFEVTDELVDGLQSLVVKVDNRRLKEGIPTVNTDWWNYGGLTREVRWVEVPQSFIQYFSVALKPGTRDTLVFQAYVNGAVEGESLRLVIPELGVEELYEPDEEGWIKVEIAPRRIHLWHPDSPKLYQVAMAYGEDHLVDRVGFRTLSTQGFDILINNRPVFLRGISIHEESPLSRARAHSRADAVAMLTAAKELGCNMVRLAHYPHNEHMARVADEMGILVWEEIPVYWTIDWENPDTLANARNQLEKMIHRDINRASVIIWSMANETPVSEARNAFLKNLVERTRELDPTRLLSAAMEVHEDPEVPNRFIIEDPFAEYTDIVSFNEYIGWYVGLPEKCASVTWHIPYTKPVFISEFGAGAKYGLHGARIDRWTEEFQQEVYLQTLPMLEKIEGLRGMSPWILYDFRSPRRHLPGVQDFYNRKGLLSEKGEKKLAWYVMKDYYTRMERRWRNR